MTSRYTEGVTDEGVISMVREAVKGRLNAMEGRGEVNFDCAETLDVFTDPVGCDK